ADTTPPGAAAFVPFRLAGTTTQVKWTPPADADYSHVVITRDAGAGPVQVYSGRGPSFLDTHTAVGHTYTYAITAFDGAGNAQSAPAATRQVTAYNAPRIVVSNPTALTTAKTPFVVTWGVANPAGTRYDVQSTVKAGTRWALQAPTAWFTGTTAGKATFSKAVLGQSYYLRARVNDAFGNSSGFPGYSSTAVPLNQTSATYAGRWQKVTAAGDWQGNAARTTSNAASAVFTVKAHKFQ